MAELLLTQPESLSVELCTHYECTDIYRNLQNSLSSHIQRLQRCPQKGQLPQYRILMATPNANVRSLVSNSNVHWTAVDLPRLVCKDTYLLDVADNVVVDKT